MTTEEKAKAAAANVRGLNHPLLPATAKAALVALADAVEALAHEVEILKERANTHGKAVAGVSIRVDQLEGVCFGD